MRFEQIDFVFKRIPVVPLGYQENIGIIHSFLMLPKK